MKFKILLMNKINYRATEPARAIPAVMKVKPPSIDVEDVSRHSNLSENWWDTNGPMRALHTLNSLRVQFIRDGLANVGHAEASSSQPLEGISIVDVGCGGGILTEPLARIGAEVTGVDPSVELINIAKKHAALDSSLTKRLNYVQTTVEELVHSNQNKFDAVVTSEVLEHVPDKETFLKVIFNRDCSDYSPKSQTSEKMSRSHKYFNK